MRDFTDQKQKSLSGGVTIFFLEGIREWTWYVI